MPLKYWALHNFYLTISNYKHLAQSLYTPTMTEGFSISTGTVYIYPMQVIRYTIPQLALRNFNPDLCFGRAMGEMQQMDLNFWGFLFYSNAEEHKMQRVNVAGFFAKEYPSKVSIDITDDFFNLPWVLNHTKKLNSHALLIRHEVGLEEDRFLKNKKTIRLYYSFQNIGLPDQ
jgi:hypothetical protein